MPRKVAILSHIVIDEIYDPTGRHTNDDVGGAGAYAAVGASLVSPAGTSLLVSGTGAHDLPGLTRWCDQRSIDPSGLFVVGDHGPRTRIEYFDDGERSETPVYGLDHFHAHTPLPRHIPGGIRERDMAAVYLFHAAEEPYWAQIAGFRSASAVPILWEVAADATVPELADDLRDHAALVDVVSLNRTEALTLFGTTSIDDAIREAAALAPVVLLRLGREGSLVLQGRRRVHVPAAPTTVADPTGGGNSYSGAFVAAYQESGDPEHAGRLAAAAAAAVIAAPGAPPVDDTVRDAVRSAAEAITTSLTG
jgi:sugar/nucleoside kinase (ribokinase family)